MTQHIRLSFECEGSDSRVLQFYRSKRLNQERVALTWKHVRASGGWQNFVKCSGPDVFAEHLYNANPIECPNCYVTRDPACPSCGGTRTTNDQWEVKTRPMLTEEFEAYLQSPERRIIHPQHVHVSFIPDYSRVESRVISNWIKLHSVAACVASMRQIVSFKPIFRPLSHLDVERWRQAHYAMSTVNIKARNTGFRDHRVYKQSPESIGIEFRFGARRRDPLLFVQALQNQTQLPELECMPLPVIDSPIDARTKRKLYFKLNGDSRWTMPLLLWERCRLLTPIEDQIIKAREEFLEVFDTLLDDLLFLGEQRADHVPLAFQGRSRALFEAYAQWSDKCGIAPQLRKTLDEAA